MLRSKSVQKSTRRRRSAYDKEEEQSRTLYIRIPRSIKSEDEIKSLFFGTFKITLPSETSSRYCHVLFSNVRDKIKNLKALRKKIVNGKRIIAAAPTERIDLEKVLDPKRKKLTLHPLNNESTDSAKQQVFLLH